MPAVPDHPALAFEQLATRAQRWFVGYGAVLAVGGLAYAAQRDIDADQWHGVRTGILFILAGLALALSSRHARTRRTVLDLGLLLLVTVVANYARLILKTLDLPSFDLPRVLLLCTFVLAGAVTVLRLGAPRLSLLTPAWHAVLRRGVAACLGAGLLAAGLLLSSDIRVPAYSIADFVETGPLAAHLEDTLEKIIADPHEFGRILGHAEVRELAGRLADDERLAGHASLREVARLVADGDLEALRARAGPDTVAAARRLLGGGAPAPTGEPASPEPSTTAPTPPETISKSFALGEPVDPTGDADAMAALRRALRDHVDTLTPERLAQLRAVDLEDPRVRDALAARDIDLALVERLLSTGALVTTDDAHRRGESARARLAPPRAPPKDLVPKRVRPHRSSTRVQHLVRQPRLETASRGPIATGIRHRTESALKHEAETPTADDATPAPGASYDHAEPVDTPDTTQAPAPTPAKSEGTAFAPGALALDQVVSLLRTASPPPRTSNERPADADGPLEGYLGAALLFAGLLVLGLSLRRSPAP